jgi:hypothetical protein
MFISGQLGLLYANPEGAANSRQTPKKQILANLI